MLNSLGCAACEGRASFFCVLRRVLIARLIKSSGGEENALRSPKNAQNATCLFARTKKHSRVYY